MFVFINETQSQGRAGVSPAMGAASRAPTGHRSVSLVMRSSISEGKPGDDCLREAKDP